MNRESGLPVALIDTKYKIGSSPSAGDVEQVIAYAKTLACPEAVLVYPQPLCNEFDHMVGGDIHVWTTHFQLSGELEANGELFLTSLLKRLSTSSSPSSIV